MRLNGRIAALLVLLAVGAAACAGNPAPEPPPVVAETVPAPDADSLAAVRAAEREAAAARLCREAASAMAAGNYDRAHSLYTQAQRDYSGTECANTAGGQIALIDAINGGGWWFFYIAGGWGIALALHGMRFATRKDGPVEKIVARS